MRTFLLPTLHRADVVMKGRRKEMRGIFRTDIAVEVRDIGRRDLAPAIRFDMENGRRIDLLADGDGRYLVPWKTGGKLPDGDVNAADSPDEGKLLATLADPAAGDRYGGDDPFTRWARIQSPGENPRLASTFQSVEEADIKEVLWSDASRKTRELHEVAARLAFVDGKLWREVGEPHWHIIPEKGWRSARIRVDGTTGEGWYSLRDFRLDRIEDAKVWLATGAGKSAVPVKGGADKQDLVTPDRFELLDRAVLKREDARIVGKSRAGMLRGYGEDLVEHLPSDAIDAYLRIVRFSNGVAPDRDAGTPAVYADLQILHDAVDRIYGLDEKDSNKRDRWRTFISPALGRWNAVEQKLYPESHTSDASEIDLRPAAV